MQKKVLELLSGRQGQLQTASFLRAIDFQPPSGAFEVRV